MHTYPPTNHYLYEYMQREKILKAFNQAVVAYLQDLTRISPELASEAFRARYCGAVSAGAPDALMRHFCKAAQPIMTALIQRDPKALFAPASSPLLLPDVDYRANRRVRAAASERPFWQHVHLLLRLACAYQLDPEWLASRAAALAAKPEKEVDRIKAAAWLMYVVELREHQRQLTEVEKA